MYSAPLRTVLFGKKTSPDLYLDFTTGQLDPRITYTHTNANSWGFNAAGVLANYTATTPKFDFGIMGGGACRGLRIEGTVTNRILWSRDGTNAAWTKSGSMTAAKDQTGLDGVVNSATRLTAGASDQTILQSLTLGSGLRVYAVYLKRITGTGAVEITDDGGSNWTAVTSNLAAAAGGWTRVAIDRTQANPNLGIRIRTSGDEVAFDCAHVEDGNIPSSPIITTSATVQRVRDDATMTGTNFSDWFNALEGTFLAEYYLDYVAATPNGRRALFQADDTTQNERITGWAMHSSLSGRSAISVYDGNVGQAEYATVSVPTVGILQKAAYSYKANSMNLAANGVIGTRDTSGTLPTLTQLVLGGRVGSGDQLTGVLKSLSYWRAESADGRLVTLSSL